MLRRISAVLGTALFLALTAPAASFATTVLVMDTDAVLNNSAVGGYIRQRLTEIGQEISVELSTQEATVRTQAEEFNSQVADKTEEEIAGDADLTARRVEIQNQVAQLQLAGQVRERELAATRNNALEPVHIALNEVLEEMVEEKGADVLVERSLVIFAGEGADVTQEVIDALNAKMTEVPVERVRLPVAEEGGQ